MIIVLKPEATPEITETLLALISERGLNPIAHARPSSASCSARSATSACSPN